MKDGAASVPPPEPSRPRDWLSPDHLPLRLLFLTFCLLVGYLNLAQSTIGWPHPDSFEYIEGARNLANFRSDFHPVGYPFLIWVGNLVVRDPIVSGKWVSTLAAVAFLWAVWRLATRFFGSRVALLTAFLVASSPPVLQSAYLIYADMPAACFFLLAILVVTGKDVPGSARSWALSGALAGMAFLTRYIYIFLPFVLPVSLWALCPSGWRRKTILTAVFGASFLAVVAPWGWMTYSHYGVPFRNLNYAFVEISVVQHESPKWQLLTPYSREYPSLLDFVIQHRLAYLKHLARNVSVFFSEICLSSLFLAGIFVLPGLVSSFKTWSRDVVLFVLASVCLLLLTASTSWDSRYLVPLVPFVASFSSWCLLSDLIPSRLREMNIGSLPIARHLGSLPIQALLVVAVVMTSLAGAALVVPWQHRLASARGLYVAGQFLRETGTRGDKVLTSSSTVAYYAGMERVSMFAVYGLRLPDDIQSLCPLTVGSGAQFLAFVEGHSDSWYPELGFLREGNSPKAPCLRFLRRTREEPRVVLYRIVSTFR